MRSGRHHRAIQIICHEGINEDSETLSISRNVTCIILNEPVGMDRVGLLGIKSVSILHQRQDGLTDAVRLEREPAALSIAYRDWSRSSPASLGGARLALTLVTGPAKMTALGPGGAEVRAGGKSWATACAEGSSQGSMQNCSEI